jgi:RHS repeat-associated protein
VVRLTSANCGSVQAQTFTYDPFGNITKVGNPGQSFQPVYPMTSNRIFTVGSTTAQYDNDGNVLTDGVHTYTWDADGNSITVDSVGATFDALDRMVEQNRSNSYTQIVYSPTGAKLALMSGQTLQKAFVPLPGQATAVYTSSGLDHYRHPDWLGSARLTSSPTRTVLSTTAYAPFGETYAQSGTADPSFTGQNSDTVSGDYDFLYREYSTQGRWPSPDPAGQYAANPMNPQSWNRYAYVLNNPLSLTDPSGLDCIYGDGEGGVYWVTGDCISGGDNGLYVDGTVSYASIDSNGNLSYGYNNNNGGITSDNVPGFGGWDWSTPDSGWDLMWLGGSNSSGDGFTLGIRAPGQTFNQCMVQNAANYSAGGAFDLAAGTTVGNSTAGQILAGNTFTGLYSAFAGSAGDAATVAGTAAPDLLNSAMGSTLTFGRRTSSILSLNLAGKGGLPQALSSSSGGLKSLLGSASKALNLGLDASVKAAGDLGLFGAEMIGCSIHR